MADVEYMHICDYAFVAEGGKPCVIGIFDRIWANAFPCTHPSMAVAVQFQGTPHERIRFRLEIVRPSGERIGEPIDGDIVTSPEGTAFVGMHVMGTAFPEAGRYTVRVTSGGRTLASHSLQLVRMQGGAPQPVPQGPVH